MIQRSAITLGRLRTQRAVLLVMAMLSLPPLFAASFVCPLRAAESAPEFRVIVHADSPVVSVSREFLTQAFLKNTSRWDHNEAIRPVDQRADSTVRRTFSERVHKRSIAAVKIYWQQRIFSGRGVPPPELDSDKRVIEYVSAHLGGVGYVSGEADVLGVKEVTVR